MKRMIFAVITALALAVSFSAPSNAAPVQSAVVTGGSGDFYKVKTYYYKGGYFKVSNYDKGTGQEYHWKLVRGDWLASQVYINGKAQGYKNFEGFTYFSNKSSQNSLKGFWEHPFMPWKRFGVEFIF